jgi:predicted TIM-barrel fold metal-dependent hydrolase
LSDRFLWGSDFPFLTPERCLEELATLGLSDGTLDRLLYANAARILDITDTGS